MKFVSVRDLRGKSAEVWKKLPGEGEMIIKVKEPQTSEYGYLREGLILFTYFHFAASRELTEACLASGLTAAAAGYGAYTKEQIAEINAKAKDAAAKAGASRFAPGGAGVGGVSANTLYLVGGVAVVGIIAAIALK